MKSHKVTFRNKQQVLALGQGTWNMGKSSSKKKEEINALRAGIDLGMSIIDTAEMYENEEMVGDAIRGLREKIFLVSKVLPSNASLDGTIIACERSLKKLGTEYIDLYLLHWRGSYPLKDTIYAMMQLVEQGKIKQWGVSNLDVDEMEEVLAIEGGETCAANQVAYNLNTRGIEYDLIPWSWEKSMPVMAYSPVGMGELSENNFLNEIAKRHNATPTQIALAWVLCNPEMIAIPKAGSVNHVKENFKSLSIKLTDEDFKELDKFFPPPTKKVPLEAW